MSHSGVAHENSEPRMVHLSCRCFPPGLRGNQTGAVTNQERGQNRAPGAAAGHRVPRWPRDLRAGLRPSSPGAAATPLPFLPPSVCPFARPTCRRKDSGSPDRSRVNSASYRAHPPLAPLITCALARRQWARDPASASLVPPLGPASQRVAPPTRVSLAR